MPHFWVVVVVVVVVDIFFLSIIYFSDTDDLIVIHSDESLDLSRSDYLDNELSSLVSKRNVVRCITFLFTNCNPLIIFQANWLEGSYQKSSGKLVIPLEGGNSLTLLLDKVSTPSIAHKNASNLPC